MRSILTIISLIALPLFATGQSYDLQQLVKKGKLTYWRNAPQPFTDGNRKAISLPGIAWLTGKNFSTGTIEVDLRGKDEFQKSFLGIAFHGIDTLTYDCVYFRPFNFRAEDPVRRIHAVQYMSVPDYDWKILRDERNGIYEKGITPAPAATDWFHARIVVSAKDIKVYVNQSKEPSLTVDKLNTRTDGLIGLWSSPGALPGDFANLVIHDNK